MAIFLSFFVAREGEWPPVNELPKSLFPFGLSDETNIGGGPDRKVEASCPMQVTSTTKNLVNQQQRTTQIK